MEETKKVKCFIRVRPDVRQKEIELKKDCLEFINNDTIIIQNPEEEERKYEFIFDRVFQPDSTQKKVFNDTTKEVIDKVLEGHNGTIFLYGQTGTGKYYTLHGREENPGILERSMNYILKQASKGSYKNSRMVIIFSAVRIYKEEAYDMSKEGSVNLRVREDPEGNFFVKGKKKFVLNGMKGFNKLMEKLFENEISLRSRYVACRQVKMYTFRIETISGNCENPKAGELSFVVFPGSERRRKIGGVSQRDMIKINWCLSCFGNVIMSLTSSKSSHIPYRDSKLTKLVKNALGGNSYTVFIGCTSKSEYNFNESLSTCRYMQRARKIKNIVKKDNIDKVITKLVKTLRNLKFQIQEKSEKGNESAEVEKLKKKLEIFERQFIKGCGISEKGERFDFMKEKLLPVDVCSFIKSEFFY